MTQQDISVQKKRGRPKGRKKPETVAVRLLADTVDRVDAWIAGQPEPRPTRAEGVAQLVSKALTDDE